MREVIHLNIPWEVRDNGAIAYNWHLIIEHYKNLDCVYCISLRGIKMYIGTTRNLYNRIKIHFVNSYIPKMCVEMRAYFNELQITILHWEKCLLKEKYFIQKYNPIYNITHKVTAPF